LKTIPHSKRESFLWLPALLPFRLSRETSDAVLEYSRKTHTLLHNTWSIRPQLEIIDKEYMMEGDLTEEEEKRDKR